MAEYAVPNAIVYAVRRRQRGYSSGMYQSELSGSISGIASLNSIPQPNIEIGVFHRKSGLYIKSVLTNELGEYNVTGLNPRARYDLIARGFGYGKNDKIRSNVLPS